MLGDDNQTTKETKGQRTANRLLDVAEELFATRGYDGTSLRQIADLAGIAQPGLYNHFAGKEALYEAVLFRALNPMAEALTRHMSAASSLHEYTDLPAVMTDLLYDHPRMAALFQRALQGDTASIGNQMVYAWLETLFDQGMQSMAPYGEADSPELNNKGARAELAINLIGMFNLTTGYFLSERVFASLAEGDLLDPENVARQKNLLRKVIRAMLVS
ncbi:MAG: helix-turn-helix domain containing protein [Halioglobus sp.]|nr:helix-turn-helix domain containing protein [Halioglobus sp.]